MTFLGFKDSVVTGKVDVGPEVAFAGSAGLATGKDFDG